MAARAHFGNRSIGEAGAPGHVIDFRGAGSAVRRRLVGRYSTEEARTVQLRESRLFGSAAFRRLWFSQLASSTGDWIGLIALTAIATRVGQTTAGAYGGISLVLAARLIPGLFLAPFAGVLVDRLNRKTIMVVCDFGRAFVLCLVPFVDTIWGLFVASLMLELFTSIWSPAKEASVPNLVKPSFLPTANSLSMVAAYGPIPFAATLFAVLVKAPEWLSGVPFVEALNLTEESLALYFDAFTYVISAAVIATLALPRSHDRRAVAAEKEVVERNTLREARDGWKYVVRNDRVRSGILGVAVGLVGGAMVVPLGSVFAIDILGAGAAGYSLLLAGMGAGVAIGVVGLALFRARVPSERAFVISLVGAGVSLIGAASTGDLAIAVLYAAFLGLFAGSANVLGITIVQANAIDEMRGRVFATLYTVTRVCVLLALTVAPLLSLAFSALSESIVGGEAEILGMTVALPGVRLTLWLGGTILVMAGALAGYSLRRPAVRQA